MILGFSCYLTFGENVPTSRKCILKPHAAFTIGLVYEKITKIIPLFVVLCVMSTDGQECHS